jgi:hypothetical protein
MADISLSHPCRCIVSRFEMTCFLRFAAVDAILPDSMQLKGGSPIAIEQPRRNICRPEPR